MLARWTGGRVRPIMWTFAVAGTTAAVGALVAIRRPGATDCYIRHGTTATHVATTLWVVAAALLGLALATGFLVQLSKRAEWDTVAALVLTVIGGAIECVTLIAAWNFCP